MKSNSGQFIPLFAVTLLLLMIVCGSIIRGGRTLLLHNQVQNHCDKKALDTGAEIAKGLERLGQINPYARYTIEARRAIDGLLISSVVAPEAIPALIRARNTLKKTQETIDSLQKGIKFASTTKASNQIHQSPPQHLRSGTKENFNPFLPRLFVKDDPEFKDEVGAPKILTENFDQKQWVRGHIKVLTESFLSKWKQSTIGLASPLDIYCDAQIKMKSLEGPWEVRLRPSEAKP